MLALTDKIIGRLEEIMEYSLKRKKFHNGLKKAIEVIQELEEDAEFEEVARVMMKHLANPEKYHPHHRVVLDSTNAELLEGKQSTGQVMDYITD